MNEWSVYCSESNKFKEKRLNSEVRYWRKDSIVSSVLWCWESWTVACKSGKMLGWSKSSFVFFHKVLLKPEKYMETWVGLVQFVEWAWWCYQGQDFFLFFFFFLQDFFPFIWCSPVVAVCNKSWLPTLDHKMAAIAQSVSWFLSHVQGWGERLFLSQMPQKILLLIGLSWAVCPTLIWEFRPGYWLTWINLGVCCMPPEWVCTQFSLRYMLCAGVVWWLGWKLKHSPKKVWPIFYDEISHLR